MPKPNREIATTAKGSGGSHRGTLCRWEALTSAATTAAIATPKKIPRARFGSLRQAAPHKARNSTRPLICSHIAMIEKSSRRRDSWRLATLPGHASHKSPHRLRQLYVVLQDKIVGDLGRARVSFVEHARRVPPTVLRECHRRQPSLIPAYRSSDRQLSEFRIRDAFPLT